MILQTSQKSKQKQTLLETFAAISHRDAHAAIVVDLKYNVCLQARGNTCVRIKWVNFT